MEKEVLDYVIEKTHELMNASSCCNEAKEAAQSWLDAIGTEDEAFFRKLSTCLGARPTYLDGSMLFCSSSSVMLNAGSAAISSRRLLSFPSTLTFLPASMERVLILS